MTVYFGAEQTPEVQTSGVLVIFSPARSICIRLRGEENDFCIQTKRSFLINLTPKTQHLTPYY